LTRIATRLRERLGAERVLVYGSVARGEASIHSDIDLLVVAPPDGKSTLRRMAEARAAIRDLSFGLPISPLVLTPDDVLQRTRMRDPFVLDILATGVAL
jgi:predicted nucleotidyltransferase